MDDVHFSVGVIITIGQEPINSARFEKIQGDKNGHLKGPQKANKHQAKHGREQPTTANGSKNQARARAATGSVQDGRSIANLCVNVGLTPHLSKSSCLRHIELRG